MDSILVLEDDPQILKLVCGALSNAGYPVIGARDLSTAAPLSGPFSLIVFDRHLPDGDGWTYAMRWRTGGTRVLCVTGSGHGQLEGIPVLRKPFIMGTLVAVVREMIGDPT